MKALFHHSLLSSIYTSLALLTKYILVLTYPFPSILFRHLPYLLLLFSNHYFTGIKPDLNQPICNMVLWILVHGILFVFLSFLYKMELPLLNRRVWWPLTVDPNLSLFFLPPSWADQSSPYPHLQITRVIVWVVNRYYIILFPFKWYCVSAYLQST